MISWKENFLKTWKLDSKLLLNIIINIIITLIIFMFIFWISQWTVLILKFSAWLAIIILIYIKVDELVFRFLEGHKIDKETEEEFL